MSRCPWNECHMNTWLVSSCTSLYCALLWDQNVSAPGVLNCSIAFPSQCVEPRCFFLCNLWWLSFEFISGNRVGFSLSRIYRHLREFLWVITYRNTGHCASINLMLHLTNKIGLWSGGVLLKLISCLQSAFADLCYI